VRKHPRPYRHGSTFAYLSNIYIRQEIIQIIFTDEDKPVAIRGRIVFGPKGTAYLSKGDIASVYWGDLDHTHLSSRRWVFFDPLQNTKRRLDCQAAFLLKCRESSNFWFTQIFGTGKNAAQNLRRFPAVQIYDFWDPWIAMIKDLRMLANSSFYLMSWKIRSRFFS